MTVRSKSTGSIVVYAGTVDELAAVADEYTRGVRSRPHGYHSEFFQRAAVLLRTGHYPAVDLGAVRFYRDRPNGEPYRGPYAPEPDEEWERRQQRLGALSAR